MTEAALVVGQQAWVIAPQIQGAQQQLGKIDDTRALAGLLIGGVDVAHGGQEQVAAWLNVLRAQAFVFLAVDEPLSLACRPLLFVQPQLAHHPFDQALLIVAVQNLKVLHKPRFLPVSTQEPMRQTVECPHPHSCRVDAQQLLDPVAHFRSSLVGEGHRQDRMRRCLLHLDKPGDAVHQHTCFTGTGASKHQLTPDRGRYSLALGVIEGIQQEGEVICAHLDILGGGRARGKHLLYKCSPSSPAVHRDHRARVKPRLDPGRPGRLHQLGA